MIIQFKQWLYFIEAIDPKDEPAIQNFITQNHPNKSQEINTFLQQFRNDPNTIPKATIFQSLNRQFPIQRNVEAIDPKVEQIYQSINIPTNAVTKPEIVTLTRFKDENPELLKELASKLRNYIQNKVIGLTINNNLITISYSPKDEQNQRTKTAKVYQADDLTKTISYIHMIGSMEHDSKFLEKDLADPRELAIQYKDELVAVSNNKKIYIFKAKDPIQCRRMGKGQNWCISSSSSVAYYFDYRFRHGQTQYFIFDFNKSQYDPARYVNPGVAPKGYYSEWVDRINQHEEDPNDPNSHFGINGYDSIENYLEYLDSQKLQKPTGGNVKAVDIFIAEKLTPEEIEIKDSNEDVNWFKNLSDKQKTLYIQLHFLSVSQFLSLDKKQKISYLTESGDSFNIAKKGDYLLWLKYHENSETYEEIFNFIEKHAKYYGVRFFDQYLKYKGRNKENIKKFLDKFPSLASYFDSNFFNVEDENDDLKEIFGEPITINEFKFIVNNRKFKIDAGDFVSFFKVFSEVGLPDLPERKEILHNLANQTDKLDSDDVVNIFLAINNNEFRQNLFAIIDHFEDKISKLPKENFFNVVFGRRDEYGAFFREIPNTQIMQTFLRIWRPTDSRDWSYIFNGYVDLLWKPHIAYKNTLPYQLIISGKKISRELMNLIINFTEQHYAEKELKLIANTIYDMKVNVTPDIRRRLNIILGIEDNQEKEIVRKLPKQTSKYPEKMK